MSMAELVTLGAPELPEGYFYRVRPTHVTEGFFVDVRRQRRFFGSVELASTIVFPSVYENGGDAIIDACCRAYRNWLNTADARMRCDEASQYIGDHDPRGGR